MTLRKIAALAASAATLGALMVGASVPASAQDWHHGYYHRHGWGGGWHRSAYGWRPAPDYGWHTAPAYAWNPGPDYAWHSWAWYHNRPAWWRREHPYYRGGPSIGVWIRL